MALLCWAGRVPIVERRLALLVDPTEIAPAGIVFPDPNPSERLDTSIASGTKSYALLSFDACARRIQVGREESCSHQLIIKERKNQFSVRPVALEAGLRDDVQPRGWL